ncbi:MAG: NAD(P)-dependent oxidoreductase [Christensenellaceae bacterium]|nr:NAD(P)-dependent oxidoreductase [Christensenellaceae bacterium]MEA5069452.1 NAD(P)-dependent oxidoreductase [Christensenellaceae bacterium]
MELVAIGGDLRYAHMVRLARREGMEAKALGLERSEVTGVPAADWADVERAASIVMPNPFAKGLVLPFSARVFPWIELEGHLRAGTTLMLFGPGEAPEAIRARHPIVRLCRDEALTCALARQTAEGAIASAVRRADYELYGCPVLIVGYGRIARSLHKMLSGYGALVTVAARREEARAQARTAGARAVDLMQMEALLPGARMVFSTPPERVLDGARVQRLRPDSLLVDLSSPPYGVDLEAAQARGVDAWREPALPGRHCPESAGAALLTAVRRAMKGEGYDG